MNFLEQISQFKPIPISQIPQLQDDFETAIIDPMEVLNIFDALHTHFLRIDFDPQFIVNNYLTYWRWYVESAWQNTLDLKQDEFAVVFPKQFVSAIVLGHPIEDRLLDFMYYKIGDTITVQRFYKDIRSAIFQEHTPLTTIDYTIAQMVEDVRAIDLKTDVEQAEWLSRLEMGIFAPGRSFFEFTSAEKSERVVSILNFINFLLEYEDISDIYEDYLAMYLDNHDSDIAKEEGAEEQKIEPQTIPAPEIAIREEKARSYQEISKQVIDSTASVPEDERDEQIITRLTELSEQYKDERIQDLYYFDEKTGKFVWNDELLASS